MASRRRMLERLTASLVALAIALKPVPGSAFIVFDPRNYAENLLSASRALEQINNQVTSLRNEAQMLINQAKNLTSLPTSMLDRIEGNFAEMKGLLGQAQRLAYSVRDIDQQFKDTYQNFGSNLTDQQMVDGARERWQGSVSAFEDALKTGAVAVGNIDGTRQQTTSLVDASQAAVGVLQATQAGNQLLAVQTSQIADLTAMMAAQGRATALESARRAAAQEQAREQFSRFMAGSDYSPTTVKMFHN
ncbi:P-type conjugative transfer protein TrbJ [Mesorhizobium sp. B2-4-16]|nr:P-type conjugative transfer protein TrbJ [Mesorhizobium sp. B2-4-16]TPL61033.1 P-type conjugative transfer protein TrbJ [Mesorhizobium sp. B2-4-3]